jgi:hypothetical protein
MTIHAKVLLLLSIVFIFSGCKHENDFQFTGKWQSLNDSKSLIEFTADNHIILYRNGKSFWALASRHGELNYEISEEGDGWYKFAALDGVEEFLHGRIEIVNTDRIRIYFHKHHDILDVADEYHRTADFNNFSEIMREI